MASGSVTMPDMAKDQPNRRGRPRVPRKEPVVFYARGTTAHGRAIEAYLASLRPKPSTTAVILVALEEFLERKGFWPPPPPS